MFGTADWIGLSVGLFFAGGCVVVGLSYGRKEIARQWRHWRRAREERIELAVRNGDTA